MAAHRVVAKVDLDKTETDREHRKGRQQVIVREPVRELPVETANALLQWVQQEAEQKR